MMLGLLAYCLSALKAETPNSSELAPPPEAAGRYFALIQQYHRQKELLMEQIRNLWPERQTAGWAGMQPSTIESTEDIQLVRDAIEEWVRGQVDRLIDMESIGFVVGSVPGRYEGVVDKLYFSDDHISPGVEFGPVVGEPELLSEANLTSYLKGSEFKSRYAPMRLRLYKQGRFATLWMNRLANWNTSIVPPSDLDWLMGCRFAFAYDAGRWHLVDSSIITEEGMAPSMMHERVYRLMAQDCINRQSIYEHAQRFGQSFTSAIAEIVSRSDVPLETRLDCVRFLDWLAEYHGDLDLQLESKMLLALYERGLYGTTGEAMHAPLASLLQKLGELPGND